MISGCVMVIGPPSLICFLNKGITDPLEPNTFPKRVQPFHIIVLKHP